MEPHEIMREAMQGQVKGIALRMGKSENYIYKMMAEAEACRYTRFIAVFVAVYEEDQVKGEEIFEDFRALVLMLREKSGNAKSENVDWLDGIAKTVEESSQAIKAAIESRDPIRVEKEMTEAITAFRTMIRLNRNRDQANSRFQIPNIKAAAAGGGR